ncbi:hypothetical protein K458DRAFT_361570 [Lentithecium fluviatile CBS 122367]|uniref:VPS9 domain-containing protein n=1 Tax=Lentithecium fluviatile CBS 122367 TaxID=1168545 RepID=A0A6G1J988_9PLEO|nr:hypothetical protein K458DRAFT_361570 [Lentithecium fluviatile CBS 122367]
MAERPKNLHASKSFSRLESSQAKSPLSRSRASTLQGPPVPAIADPLKTASPSEEDEHTDGDVFATKIDTEEEAGKEPGVPDSFEELPIEIRSLTERFLESLSAKVHPSPLSADALSDLFQDFYTRASAKINTHIATLSARLTSDTYKKTPASSRPGSIRSGSGDGGEQQMLSATEMSDRKRARRLLEVKRAALEEAVERAVCEKVYDRIWRHRSTDDEERDHKLRSRTAALSLVGIGLRELLMTAEDLTEENRQKSKEREDEIREWLSSARDDLLKMNSERYPLGKLHHLTAAHKSIVEALSKIFPASSSADEILPTLIFTLITMPPSSLNVIGDLKFIQRFRGSSRMDGETAYCLVNLEAAVSFLETVDLSSLRADEGAGLERTNSRPSTPRTEVTPMALGLAQSPDLAQTLNTSTAKPGVVKEPPSPTTTKAQRRLSNLIQAQTNRIEAASDAVRDSILDSADQALGRINNTLDNSFKFFFGKIKDQNPNSPVHEPELPKTLEDARKLVSSPSRIDEEDNASVSVASSIMEEDRPEDKARQDLGSKMTDLFAGRRPIRDRSVDSTQSAGSSSGKRVAFTASSNDGKTSLATPKTESPAPNNPSAVDSIRNLGNNFNPLNRFASINVLPRFGRAVSSGTSTPTIATHSAEQTKQLPTPPAATRTAPGGSSEVPQVDDKGVRAVAALDILRKTTPPVKRFLEAKDAQELKLKEVDELLKEYQRLAAAMRGAINY